MLDFQNNTEVTLIDSHCHIDFAEFDADRDQVLRRASDEGVRELIIPAVSADRWQQTIAVCMQHTNCHLALGLHPVFIEDHQPQHLSELSVLVDQHSPIAIGEIGLDFFDQNLDREKQRCYFDKQLIIAKRKQLPVIIHNRKAHDECIKLLMEHRLSGGIIHAFNGSLQQAHKYAELGFCLGFGGMLTYPRSSKLRRLAAEISIEHIVLETDSPDMTVAQHRGQRNSPEYLPLVLTALAEIKNISAAEIAAQTSHNVRRIFAV